QVAIARGLSGDQDVLLDPNAIPPDFATGVIIDRSGLILTNYHAIGDPRQHDYAVWVHRRGYRAEVHGADPYYDLAVLKIEAPELVPIEFGDASQLRKGQFVIALGNPLAIARDGNCSASWGMISNFGRKPPPERGTDENPAGKITVHHYGNLIQTDARLELGTSGGALLNLQGQMIGLTSSYAALHGYEQSAGFAIPVDDALRRVIDKLKEGDEAQFGFLGIAPEQLLAAHRARGWHGVRVGRVVNATPAAAAGLLVDDVITHVGDQPVFDSDSLFLNISRFDVGREVPLSVRRKKRELVLTVRLTKKFVAHPLPAITATAPPSWQGIQVDYATALPRFEQRADDADPQGCVAVTAVATDSPGWKAGLRPGHFISHVGQRRVSTPTDFFAILQQQIATGEQVTLQLRVTVAVNGQLWVSVPINR
ncbi:MAG: trypsin-like peptidase domain-containing protein, partial [Planctomycetales bacterium]|nr:trypsin-like peptidase domain-containing protein [Planctomycetales bacterium]